MRRAIGLCLAAGLALSLLDCGEPSPGPRQANWGPACVSGQYWAYGDRGDNHMHPGRACIQCHNGRRRGPTFSVAGTLYTALHEEDECRGNGGTEGARPEVEITDNTGEAFYITANAWGNFYTTHRFQLPLRRARVRTRSGRILEMGSPPPHGDCNFCHTREGLTDENLGPAPGRIRVP